MINKITIIFILSVLFIACTEDKPLTFSQEEFTQNNLDECKNDSCPKITIKYLKASGNEEVERKINEAIENDIIDGLNPIRADTTETAGTFKSITEAAESFIENYKRDLAEFPDMASGYESKIDITKSHVNADFVSLKSEIYGYMGGAHGFTILSFLNFDAQTGKHLDNDDLFINRNAFKDFAEKKFREKFDIGEDDDINSTGFWFKDEKFVLPESIGFSGNNMVLIYNQYEIASYAEGQIELKIPINEADEYLVFK